MRWLLGGFAFLCGGCWLLCLGLLGPLALALDVLDEVVEFLLLLQLVLVLFLFCFGLVFGLWRLGLALLRRLLLSRFVGLVLALCGLLLSLCVLLAVLFRGGLTLLLLVGVGLLAYQVPGVFLPFQESVPMA